MEDEVLGSAAPAPAETEIVAEGGVITEPTPEPVAPTVPVIVDAPAPATESIVHNRAIYGNELTNEKVVALIDKFIDEYVANGNPEAFKAQRDKFLTENLPGFTA